MKLIMKRVGKFECSWRNAENKCGVGEDLNPWYSYQCYIEADSRILDAHGFIIDQLDVDKYFQDKYKFARNALGYPSFQPAAKSCEQIALASVRDIKQMVENHMHKTLGWSKLYCIRVTIGVLFNETATLTAEWTPEYDD